MMVELVPDDRLARPMIGPADLTREQAHAVIQQALDQTPALAELAATWRRGARDDTVSVGLLTWTIYEHPNGEDPRRAAIEWLDGFAATMRSAGMDVRVAHPPDDLAVGGGG